MSKHGQLAFAPLELLFLKLLNGLGYRGRLKCDARRARHATLVDSQLCVEPGAPLPQSGNAVAVLVEHGNKWGLWRDFAGGLSCGAHGHSAAHSAAHCQEEFDNFVVSR